MQLRFLPDMVILYCNSSLLIPGKSPEPQTSPSASLCIFGGISIKLPSSEVLSIIFKRCSVILFTVHFRDVIYCCRCLRLQWKGLLSYPFFRTVFFLMAVMTLFRQLTRKNLKKKREKEKGHLNFEKFPDKLLKYFKLKILNF